MRRLKACLHALSLSLAVWLGVSPAALAQSVFSVRTGIPAFEAVNVARRINVTLVCRDEVDKLPADVYARLKRSKAAMADVAAGASVCVVKAEASVARAVRCQVESGTLNVYADKFKYRRSPSIEVFVVYSGSISAITGASGSNIATRGTLKTENLSISPGFAMSIRVSVLARAVSVVARDHSEVWLMGAAESITAELDNSSTLRMRRMSCRSVALRASNGSRAQVNAENSLAVVARGRSDVSYFAPGCATSFEADDFSRIYEQRVQENM